MFVNGYYEVGDRVLIETDPTLLMRSEAAIVGFTPKGCAIVQRYNKDGQEVREDIRRTDLLEPVWPLKPAPGIYWVQRPDDPEPWLARVALEEDKMRGVLEVIRMRRMVPSVVDMGECEIIPPSKRRYSPKDFPPDTQWWPVVKPEGRKVAEPAIREGRRCG